jgi:hypothetical protein
MDECRKSRPLPGFDPRTIQLETSRRLTGVNECLCIEGVNILVLYMNNLVSVRELNDFAISGSYSQQTRHLSSCLALSAIWLTE